MDYISHNYNGISNPLHNHLLNVGNGCGSGLFFNVGLLHDFGKYRPNMQRYLRGDDVRPQDKTHSVAGALMLHKMFARKTDPITLAIGMIAIACHHTGLQDNISDRLSSLEAKREFEESTHPDSLKILNNLQEIQSISGDAPMLTRMTLSKLVDADWADAAKIYGNYKKFTYNTLQTLKDKFVEFMASLPRNKLSDIRNTILENCIRSSSNPPGWHSLNVPTGGGKTLSGMAFALNHALIFNKPRIIVVIPYTSIIDQTHQVYADIFGEYNVLAHHSNIEPTSDYRIKAQTWDPPIIVTTMVQFLETLHACKNKKLRKLRNVENSVIIIDESQNLPIHLMDMTMQSLQSLVDDFGCTIVTSTATQVDLSRWGVTPKPIIEDHVALHNHLRRTHIQYVPELDVVSAIINGESSLTIVNTRKAAIQLFNQVSPHTECYYLSTLMYPTHRKKVLAEIKSKLKNGETVKIISTQLIEAGVDIDLPVVYREIAGVDSIIQAAGRCNRNGNHQIGNVFVVGQISEHVPELINRAISCTYRTMQVCDLNNPEVATIYAKLLMQDTNTDSKNILSLLDPRPHKIQFAEIANRYKVVENNGFAVICNNNIDLHDIHEIQKYIVNLYDKDIKELLTLGAIKNCDDLYEDTYVITDDRWYSPTMGVVIDTSPSGRYT